MQKYILEKNPRKKQKVPIIGHDMTIFIEVKWTKYRKFGQDIGQLSALPEFE